MIQTPGEGDMTAKYLLHFKKFILGTGITAKQIQVLQEELTVISFT